MLRIFEKARRVVAWLGVLPKISGKLIEYYAKSPHIERNVSHIESCYRSLELLWMT